MNIREVKPLSFSLTYSLGQIPTREISSQKVCTVCVGLVNSSRVALN